MACAEEDLGKAKDIVTNLEGSGFRCWINDRGAVGRREDRTVLDAIRTSPIFLLLFSSHSCSSKDILRDLDTAFNARRSILYLRIDDTTPTEEVEYYMSRQWIDATSLPIEELMPTLVSLIRRELDELPPPPPDNPRLAPAPMPSRAIGSKSPEHDFVQFTATTPARFSRGISMPIFIWLHTKSQAEEVTRRAAFNIDGPSRRQTVGGHKLKRGKRVDIHLESKAVTISDPSATVVWWGKVVGVSFLVEVPQTCDDSVIVTARFRSSGIEIARLYIDLQIGSDNPELSSKLVRIERAFASHANEDSREVLARIQGMEAIAPWLQIFYDTVSIRQGERWKERLVTEIEKCDVFFLFWSAAASKSPWVNLEWRYALAERGIDFISPVPLVSPSKVPPPKELNDYHFNHWALAFAATPRKALPWWKSILRR